MPVVSVIIPVYNGERTLRETVESLRRGEFEDWEMILVDDGSSDDSPAICRELEGKDARIRVCSKGNGGAASARNYGLDRARGDYVAFVDADDRVDRAYLQSLVAFAEEHRLDWVVCAHRRRREKGKDPRDVEPVPPVFAEETVLRGEDGRQQVFRSIFEGIEGASLFSNCMGIYRRSMLEKEDLRIPEDLGYGEDTLFNYTAAHFIRGFGYVPEPLYEHLIHEGSSSLQMRRGDFYLQEMRLVEKLDRMRESFGDPWTEEMKTYAAMQFLGMFRYQLLLIGDRGEQEARFREVKERLRREPLAGILSGLRRRHTVSLSQAGALYCIRRGWYGLLRLVWGAFAGRKLSDTMETADPDEGSGGN